MSELRRRSLLAGKSEWKRPDGCVLEYLFDDQTFNDTSGNGYNGTQGGASYTTGIVGSYAARKTAASAASSFPSAAITSLPVSFSFWIEHPASNATRNDAIYVYRPTSRGGFSFQVTLMSGNANILFCSNALTIPWVPGKIDHICIVIDTTKNAIVYVNGEVLGTISCNYSFGANYSYIVGANGTAESWKARFDNFRIFNKILSQSDVLTLYQELN